MPDPFPTIDQRLAEIVVSESSLLSRIRGPFVSCIVNIMTESDNKQPEITSVSLCSFPSTMFCVTHLSRDRDPHTCFGRLRIHATAILNDGREVTKSPTAHLDISSD
jgi:hypothetical protein